MSSRTPTGESFVYNGTHVDNLVITAGPNSGAPDPVIALESFGGVDGAAEQGSTYRPRTWTDTCQLTGADFENAGELLDALNLALDPRNGSKTLRYDKDLRRAALYQRQWTARLNGPIIVRTVGIETAQFQLNWLAAQPFAKAIDAITITPAIASSPDTFTISTDGVTVVAGTNTVKPVYTLRNTTGGNITTVTLSNDTTVESLTWTGNLGDDSYLRIDTLQERLWKSATGAFAGEESNQLGGLTDGDPFPRLAPGVVNTYTVTGLATGTTSIVYTPEFI